MNKESLENKIIRLGMHFKKSAVSWIGMAAFNTQGGTKAIAVPYINARDVMDRLDEVLGAENWKDEYTVHEDRTTCTIYVKIDGEWVGKSDGANDTDIEGAKGAYSSAFKRAAVKWGIGRYIYDVGEVFCPCECKKKQDGSLFLNQKGKPVFKKFIGDPWDHVNAIPEVTEESKKANANGMLYKIQENYPEILSAFLKDIGEKNEK